MSLFGRINRHGAAPSTLALGAVLLLGPAPVAGQMIPLRAGFERVEITPTTPVRLSGYAGRTGVSKGVHDPLSARVIAFEQDGHRLVLVATDLIGFYGEGVLDAVRSAILEECRLEPAELFLTAIHTHSGPSLSLDESRGHPANVAYTKELIPKLAAAVREALAHTAPVRLGYGSGSAPVAANRRQRGRDQDGNPTIVLGRNPAAPIDREVQVLTVRRADADGPSAVLFAFATHSTALGPRNLQISGDIHGLAAQFVEKQFPAAALAPAFAGASGDIDPWFRVLPGFRTENGWVPEPVLLGTLLGQEVVRAAGAAEPVEATCPIRAVSATVPLPRKPDPAAGTAPAPDATVPFTVSVARVGDVAFVGLGGEVFNEIGQAIKAASPFPRTIVVTHCNGTAGYLPTRPSYEEGGYEVQNSPFAPAAAEQLTTEVGCLLESLMQPAP